MNRLPSGVEEELRQLDQALTDLLLTLCAIPAPSNQEERRAQYIYHWLKERGAHNVTIDPAQNVVYPVGCEGQKDILVFMAHTDTVFPDLTPMRPRIEQGKLYCPGAGDNTANVAALMVLLGYILKNRLTPKRGVLIVFNAGEEGLGNLKGCRRIFADYGGRVAEMVALDGGYTHLCNRAVGSTRYRVTVKTQGGHSYGDFGNPNAIALLSSLITDIYGMQPPQEGESKSTYNVGCIEGGTSINTIAQQAAMLLEFRSDSRKCLAEMEAALDNTLHAYRSKCEVETQVLGRRPCMGDVDPARQAALEARCQSAIRAYTGQEAPVTAGSTDCNISFSLGVPSVCLGAYEGHGAHTREEYVELSSLQAGLQVVGALVLHEFAL